MTDDPFVLFDELLAVAEQWQSVAAEYDRHAVGFLNGFWPAGGSASRADLGAGTQLIVHVAQLQVMRAWLRMIDDLLNRAEDYRATTISLQRPGVIHTPPVEGDASPEPF